jgi:hypothetical protein
MRFQAQASFWFVEEGRPLPYTIVNGRWIGGLVDRSSDNNAYNLLATGNWQLATGNWQLATGNWQLATGNWQLATGNWQLATDYSFVENT